MLPFIGQGQDTCSVHLEAEVEPEDLYISDPIPQLDTTMQRHASLMISKTPSSFFEASVSWVNFYDLQQKIRDGLLYPTMASRRGLERWVGMGLPRSLLLARLVASQELCPKSFFEAMVSWADFHDLQQEMQT